MFGIGSTEFLVILLVALVVLGPKSLASVSRTLGKAMGEFRRVSTDFQRTLNAEVEQEEHLKRKQEAEKEFFSPEARAEHAAKTAAPGAGNGPACSLPAPGGTRCRTCGNGDRGPSCCPAGSRPLCRARTACGQSSSPGPCQGPDRSR